MAGFSVGEVVRLKSGGPAMTVEFLRAPGVVECCWFEGGRKFATTFQAETLTAAAADLPGPGEIEEIAG